MLFNVFRNQDASDPFLAFSPSCRFEHFSEFPISYGGRTRGKAEGGGRPYFPPSPPLASPHVGCGEIHFVPPPPPPTVQRNGQPVRSFSPACPISHSILVFSARTLALSLLSSPTRVPIPFRSVMQERNSPTIRNLFILKMHNTIKERYIRE